MQKDRARNGKDMRLAEIMNPTGHIAFLDAEFNAGMDYRLGEKINDVISVGIIICDENYNEVERYYSLVRQINKVRVFPLISRMTGITTDMLKNAPTFAEVSNDITALAAKYQVSSFYTWGNSDGHSLTEEKNIYRHKHLPGSEKAGSWHYMERCEDVSGLISNQLLGIRGGLSINVENLMFFCEIDEVQDHNALMDAYYLYKCVEYLRGHFPPSNGDREFMKKRELVNRFYQERSAYNSFRRFRSTGKGGDLYCSYGQLTGEDDIRIKALEDDLAFLKGEIPYDTEFATIREYFDEKMKQ